MVRPKALMTPDVSVRLNWPKGLPMAMARWPTRSVLDSPSTTGVTPAGT